jgi:Tfp pilus assembly major pilin PilA
MNYQITVNAILGVLTVSTTISVVLLQRRTERLKIIEGQLSQSKYKAYGELVAIFYDLLKETKTQKKMNNEDVMTRMINAKKDLFIYGSDIVFKKFVAWLTYTSTNPGDSKHFKLFLSLLIEMRKDMGNPKTKLTPKDIMISLLQSEKEFQSVKDLIE